MISLHHEHLRYRGHPLIWGVHNPKWWYMAPYTSYTPDQLRGILKLHIDTVLKRYGDSLFAWDVVNECVADGTGTEIFKTNDWYPKVPDYVNLAFLQANASRKSTDVKLFLNDYGMESTIGWTKTKADKFYNLVKKMINDNIPIDGVGFQLHVTVNTTIIEGVKLNMERFNKLGLEVHMTEVDVSCNFPNPCTNWDKDRETRQAEVYAALLAACMEAPNCKSFEIWGPSDLLTWRGSAQYPLPWDDKLVPKLAVTAMRETLLGDTKWSRAYYDRLRRENRVDKALPPPPASGL
jgi:endo-1,4-beta-xylanase